MKILLVNDVYSYSAGIESYVKSLVRILRERGQKIYFYSSSLKPLEDNYEYAKYFPECLISAEKSCFQKLILNFRNPEAEKKLDSYLNAINPDIVYSATIDFIFYPYFLKVCYEHNVPVILRGSQLGCPAIAFRQGGEHYCSEKLCLGGGLYNCVINRCFSKKIRSNIFAVAKYLYIKHFGLHNKASRFICASEATRRLMEEYGIQKEKLVVISNFVDSSFLVEEPTYTDKGYFLYVGRLSKEKGVTYLLEAISKLPDFMLHIVGAGPEEEKLREQASRLGLTNVVFRGLKSGEELIEEYRHCIASILPCDWFEIFGITIVESFALGKPVIASRVGGIPEIVEDGVNGILVEPADVSSLAEAISKLGSNPELVLKMGRKARKKAEEHYSPASHYNRIMEVFSEVVAFSDRDVVR